MIQCTNSDQARFLRFALASSTAPAAAVMISVAVQASHMPVMPHAADMRNAAGTMTISPRSRETTCAGTAFSTEVKYVDKITLYPINKAEVK